MLNSFSVIVEGVSKKFRLGYKRQVSTLGSIVSLMTGKQQYREICALKNVSFKVGSGQIIGLIGKNGSGKSTLLRMIAGIYQADQGNIEVKGKLVYVAGLGKGLRKELTMQENIFLGAALMGLDEKDTRRVFEDIVNFSGLHDFVDSKLDHFSTGMAGRLAFSISLYCVKHQNPDVLLLDEVFGSGGDIDFNTKALKKMEDLVKGGATVILVSHRMELIQEYCPTTVWLDQGEIVTIGETRQVVQAYLETEKKPIGSA